MRLSELQRVEEEARLYREDERRAAAQAKDRVTFKLADIIINQVVFMVEDKEDLQPFVEVIETTVEVEEGGGCMDSDAVEEEGEEEDGDDNENEDGEQDDDDDENDEEDDESSGSEEDDDDDEEDEDDDEEYDSRPPAVLSANLLQALGMDTSNGMDPAGAVDWKPPERHGIENNPDSLKVMK